MTGLRLDYRQWPCSLWLSPILGVMLRQGFPNFGKAWLVGTGMVDPIGSEHEP
ncbi:hypothetical protein FHU38_003499 [Saccharomonospora amisosensis]|uniref:Uncharacterized protein n=1 Tax=Saccharomonospora amisosensis TaxID=1128677 RepID=A0A7X5US61_9PSEU|nr:hypothetical protein [Saccharomonospora amisosensis]